MAAKKKAAKKTPTRGKRKPAPEKSKGLSPSEVTGQALPDDIEALTAQIAADGGAVMSAFRDPLEGHWVVMAAVPLEKVAPTSFQRDVSDTHVDKLVDAIQRTGRFLDPVICVRDKDGIYRVPNGGHRLAALTRLGAKTITALVLPDPALAFKILALNVEKAHVLKERALEVIRMVRALAGMEGLAASLAEGQKESDYAADLEDPAYATLGICYEENGRFAGSAYHPILKRIDAFLDRPLPEAVEERQRRAARVIEIEGKVSEIIKGLKAKGFDSPYLRNFVVARVNPLRGKKAERKKAGEGPKIEKAGDSTFDDTLDKMLDKATAFDLDKVNENDVAAAG